MIPSPWLAILIPFGLWLYRLDKRLDKQDFQLASIRRFIIDAVNDSRK